MTRISTAKNGQLDRSLALLNRKAKAGRANDNASRAAWNLIERFIKNRVGRRQE